MAATYNNTRSSKDGLRGNMGVLASTRIFDGSMIFNNGGRADNDTGSGTKKFEGVAVEEANNSGGGNDDITVEFLRKGVFPFDGSGFSLTTVGKRAYALDDNTVTNDASAAGAVPVGVFESFISSTRMNVDIMPELSRFDADEVVEITANLPALAGKTVYNIFAALEALQVLGIKYTPDVAQGGALTATVVKATGTATPASATTPMCAAGAIDLNGTAHTVQSIALTATGADLILAAGDRIGVVLSGAMTTGSGNFTIRAKRL